MIQANELRIGNYLNGFHPDMPDKKVVVVVTGITKGFIFWEPINIVDVISIEAEPIPITEEWLLRCGFEKISDGAINKDFVFRGKFMVQLDVDSGAFDAGYIIYDDERIVMGGYVFNNFTNGVQYVHELQNLIFALMNIELIIK